MGDVPGGDGNTDPPKTGKERPCIARFIGDYV
jgi:hypothetical protein